MEFGTIETSQSVFRDHNLGEKAENIQRYEYQINRDFFKEEKKQNKKGRSCDSQRNTCIAYMLLQFETRDNK